MQVKNIKNQSSINQKKQMTFGSMQSHAKKIGEFTQEKYFKSGIVESIKRNGHMNKYSGEPVDLQKAKAIVTNLTQKFIKDFENKPKFLLGEMAEWCRGFAKNFYKTNLSKDTSLSVNTRDAVIVDYLNFMIAKQGGDLTMYTKDLKKCIKS